MEYLMVSSNCFDKVLLLLGKATFFWYVFFSAFRSHTSSLCLLLWDILPVVSSEALSLKIQ